MNPRIITLCYRKVIDKSSATAWDRFVYDDSYTEFCMQAQTLDPAGQYPRFGQLLHHVPEAAQLHHRVSAAVTGYIGQLNERVPDIANILGQRFLTFRNFRFEIINSDLNDKAKHQVAVNFYTEPLAWLDTIGQNLLVAPAGPLPENEAVFTHLFSLRPFLSIHTLQNQTEPCLH
ncbi:MAG: hypothetical protein INR69_06480 [Mucilaginibacter polytrichastri]|nr:hypothetical protein [Mucilaginibacter polytrichastri]